MQRAKDGIHMLDAKYKYVFAVCLPCNKKMLLNLVAQMKFYTSLYIIKWLFDNDNDNDNENMFITIDLHIYRIQDARYQDTENKHLTLFFLW